MEADDRLTGRRVSFAELDLPVQFRAPGQPLATRVREVTYVREEGDVSECRLTLALAPEAYQTVDREHLFHLAPEARGPGADRFAPAGPVHVEASLTPELLPELLAAATQPWDAGDRLGALADAGERSPLLETESWFALSVTAPVIDLPAELEVEGSLEEGYSTTWAAGGGPLRLPMLAVVEQVLEDRGWRYEHLDDNTGMRWRMRSSNGAWTCWALARDSGERLAVYSVLDAAVPEDLRTEAAVLIARINHGLAIGNWELDMDSGTVRYGTGIDVAGDRLSVALAARVIERNLLVVDIYVAGLTAFIEGRATATEALVEAEG